MHEESKERDLREHSDRLLSKVREIQAMERTKREEEISSPEFHALADSIVDTSREVFRLAAEQQETSEQMERIPDRTTEDLPTDGTSDPLR
jgi:small-conductance mechanosensitive channel